MSLVRAARKIARLYFFAIVGFLVFGALVLTLFGGQSPGLVDATMAKNIRHLCAEKPACQFRLQDVLPGDYDLFYEFGPYQQQEDLSRELGPNVVPRSELQRLLVFSKDGHITQTQYADFGVQRPMNGEVVFEEEFTSPTPSLVRYQPGQLLQVTFCDTNLNGPLRFLRTGTYFLLSPTPINPDEPPQCQTLF